MPITPERLRYLLQQYAADGCTKKELEEVFGVIGEAENSQELEGSLRALWLELTGSSIIPGIDKEKVYSTIISDPAFAVGPARRLWVRNMAAAAILILVSGAGLWTYFASRVPALTAKSASLAKGDANPGGNKATLTLADGTTVYLDSLRNGAVQHQGGTKLTKQDSGQLVYKVLSGAGDLAMQYNKIATPRGGQYQVVLPDGTKVWLNASSSLRFPTAFAGNQRRVELTGEAYFEVAADPSRPFTVNIGGGQAIQVLGTNFNINAYDDESAIRATLLEGSIRLSKGREQVLLRPGQQAVSGRTETSIHIIPDADTEAAIAWKNGYFQFDGVGLETVMRQLSRWYDVDVKYEGPIPERQFAGQMPRGVNLSEVLRILEESDVHFRIEGKQLVVTP